MIDPENDNENLTLQDIIEAQRLEDMAEVSLVEAKESVKEAKDTWEKARDHRVSLVRNADQRRLPITDFA